MQNLIALSSSFIYIFIVLICATLVAKYSKGASETSRKLVHILVGNWVFLTPLFQDLWAVVLVPFSFILINSLSMKYKLIPAMERDDDSLGTVYYAISLFVLSGAGFIFNWPRLPYIGVLTMAYGDGLAAVIGQKYGKRLPFKFAPNKSLLGSLIVALVSFIVTALVLYVVRDTASTAPNLPLILLVSLATAIVASGIELVGNKGCDNLSLPLGSALFAELSIRFASPGLLIYMLLCITILVFAYIKDSITASGIIAAILTAITLFTLGGPWLGSSLILFFILGTVASKIKNKEKIKAEDLQESTGARSWQQVLANSLPATILLWIHYLYPETSIFLFLAFSVFSAASADTFSSEIGMLSKGRVFNILNGKTIPNGVSGGVTGLGLIAGACGSMLLSLLLIPTFGLKGFFYASLLGILGSLIDSILGASIQRKYKGDLSPLQDKASKENDTPIRGYKFISNNSVNILTLFIVTILGYMLFK